MQFGNGWGEDLVHRLKRNGNKTHQRHRDSINSNLANVEVSPKKDFVRLPQHEFQSRGAKCGRGEGHDFAINRRHRSHSSRRGRRHLPNRPHQERENQHRTRDLGHQVSLQMKAQADQDDRKQNIGWASEEMRNKCPARNIVIPRHYLAQKCVERSHEHDQGECPQIGPQCGKMIEMHRDPASGQQQHAAQQLVAGSQ